MVDPTTLQIPKMVAPLDLANLMAAKVSAVSPDCDMAITISFSLIFTVIVYNQGKELVNKQTN